MKRYAPAALAVLTLAGVVVALYIIPDRSALLYGGLAVLGGAAVMLLRARLERRRAE